MKVPFMDLYAQNKALKLKIFSMWENIFDSSQFVGGPVVQSFEKDFAEHCTVKECVAVSSGTDALRLIFIALGLKKGDQVITVPNTFIATTEAITQAGGTIRFVDIDPKTYTIDPTRIEEAITERTKGIVPVHLYGHPADMDPILEIAGKYGLWVVEDACQAHLAEYKGKKVGSLGSAAAFSFYPAKNIGACGESGAITTNDLALAQTIRQLRDHGQGEKYFHNREGFNNRCDALQASVLLVKLAYLSRWNEARRRNAQEYFYKLQDCDKLVLPAVAAFAQPVFHLFVIQVEDRDFVAEQLNKREIGTGYHYPVPLHLQKAYAYLNLPPGSFPVTEQFARKLISLPMYPELSSEQISYVCQHLQSFLNPNLKGG